jgi:hypothetical protein
VLLWHGGYCHASVLLTDHNLAMFEASENKHKAGESTAIEQLTY